MIPQALRWMAVAIALAAVIDPAVTTARSARPEVAVVAVDSARDADLADRVARELGERFTVIPASFSPAGATVIVGARLPAPVPEVESRAFGVVPDHGSPVARIEAVNVPDRAALDARVPVSATVRVAGAQGRDLETSLHMGDAVIDRAVQRIESDDDHLTASLSFIPTAAGAVPLRISTRLADLPATDATRATADLVIDVRDDRWGVLFFDPRPSWLSTFVRRSVERDPRFVVTSRVVTSRNVSIDAGRPPASLADAASLAEFDAVVVGAAQLLSERDVAGLETFLRRRGGTVILLIDERASGPYDRLTGVRQWNAISSAAGFAVVHAGGDSARLRTTSLAWPATLPAGAETLATSGGATEAGARGRPVVWRSAVGAGQIVVSGAIDAWRYRDPAQSSFDRFWRATVADAAVAGSTSIEIALDDDMLEPGARAGITVTLRALALAEGSTGTSGLDSMAATIETPSGAVPLRLWPDAGQGRFRGAFLAPRAAGTYRVSVSHEGARTDVPLVVSATATAPSPDESDLVGAWVASRGGRVLRERPRGELGPMLEDLLQPAARSERWHPMRSAWWIVPFALLLGAEWLWRRRTGLP